MATPTKGGTTYTLEVVRGRSLRKRGEKKKYRSEERVKVRAGVTKEGT